MDLGMNLSELGEPNEYFNALKVGVGSLWVASEGGHGSHPGFAKWTMQPSPGLRRSQEEKTHTKYSDEAQVHFTGKMLDGTVFASTREYGVPLTFIIGQEDVMQGLSMAVSSMQEGEKAVFTIPPELAGTKSGCPAAILRNIPPNQGLWFDIELISLVTITDILGNQGILKKTIKHGMGNDKPRRTDLVLVNYNVCLQDGVSVSKSDGFEFYLREDLFYDDAFEHAVKTMTEGEEALFIVKPKYVTSRWLYRPPEGNGADVLPDDATLYLYVQLMSWKTVSYIGEDWKIRKTTLRRGNLVGEHTENQAVVRDGTVFDQRGGHEGNEPFEFVVDEGHVSYGLEEAVLSMREGEVALFTIPPQYLHDHFVAVPPGSSVTYKIELVSVVNDEHPRIMSKAESIETAATKEKEGDKLFSSSKFLIARSRYNKVTYDIMSDFTDLEKPPDMYLRYQEAREIILSRFQRAEIDGEIKQLFISLTLKSAECDLRLGYFGRAGSFCREVLEYDSGNVRAQEMIQEERKSGGKILKMASSDARLKHQQRVDKLKDEFRRIYVPSFLTQRTDARPSALPAKESQDPPPKAKSLGHSCFGW